MYAKHRRYILVGEIHRTANFTINPIGFLHLDVVGTPTKVKVDFNDLLFEKYEEITKITGISENNKNDYWNIELDNNDAKELQQSINEAIDEYEIMMKDL